MILNENHGLKDKLLYACNESIEYYAGICCSAFLHYVC